MFLSSLSVSNFRKHINASFQFSEGLNYIVGQNSVGKTSVLEAIHYLCSTKSLFAKDSEVVSFNADNFTVEGMFRNKNVNKVRVYFSILENKKYFILNGKQINKSSEIIGKFPFVTLTPDDHKITLGTPSDRRKFFDSVFSQANKTYLDYLIDYNKILKHRAVILTQLSERKTPSLLDELDSWTENLVDKGSQIIKYRKKFLEDFNSYLLNSYIEIMGEKEIPSIRYQTISNEKVFDEKTVLKKLINENQHQEIIRNTNLFGPHRDDFVFEINGINLKKFGSQGQNKTFQISLKFAEFFYLKEFNEETPIFLLDDVFGELDSFRSKKVSEYLQKVGQAFITLTDLSNMSFLSKSNSDLIINLN
ncbi:MAG: DNA replication and repair protein RecF [Ignavibacterium sp.]|nr:DNA replication and repair protein RecF [Ignavibacterium sp.]MCX7611132.1 DNA replication and repair protein RecF [Ignavibacterium sp.]MDW8376003.1 DNA replication and repair protein RecF [Ignavibacteriales bacterium]